MSLANSTLFRKGRAFSTYQVFESELAVHCEREQVKYVTEKGEKQKGLRASDPDRPYAMKRLVCHLHKRGCNAHIRICLKSAGANKGKYQITSMCAKHNHNPSSHNGEITSPRPTSFSEEESLNSNSSNSSPILQLVTLTDDVLLDESESESATYSVDSSTISNEDETSGWLDPLDLELLDEILQREEKQQHKINVEAADLLFSENEAYTNANASIGLDLTQIDSIDWEMANACFGLDMPSANGFTTTLASQLSCGLRRLLGQFRYFRYYWAMLSLVCMGAATLYASYLDSRRFSHPRVVLQF